MLNFRIVENASEDYLENYEDFKKDYVAGILTVAELRDNYNYNGNDYKKAIRRMREEGIPLRQWNVRHYVEVDGKYRVQKGIKGHVFNYGTYDTKEIAQKIIIKLKECNWDKSQLDRIKGELGL